MQVIVLLRSLMASNIDGVPLTPTELETGEATRFWDEDMLNRAIQWSEESPVAASSSIGRSLAQDFESEYSRQQEALQMASASDLEEAVPLGPEEAPEDAPEEVDAAREGDDLLDTEAEPCGRDAQRALRSEKQDAQRRRGRGGGRGRGKRGPVDDGMPPSEAEPTAKKARPAAKKAAAKKVLKRPAAKQLQHEEPIMPEPITEEPIMPEPMTEEPVTEQPVTEEACEPEDAEASQNEPSPAEVTRGRGRGRGRGKKPKLVISDEQKRICKENLGCM